MTAQEVEFRRIDNAMRIYYKRLGKSDYINSDGNGKFLNHIKVEQLDDPDIPIENELGLTRNPNDCIYIGFVNDEDFPTPFGVEVANVNKSVYIFYIIQYCWQYGYPPSDEYIRNVVVPTLGGYPHAVTVNNMSAILLAEIYQQVMCYMIGFAAGWLVITGLHLGYYISNLQYFDDDGSSDEFELEEGEPMEIQSDWEENVAM